MDRSEKIWAWANTGTKIHGFVQNWTDKDGNESKNFKRALCRKSIARNADGIFVGLDVLNATASICTRCLELAEAMWDRAEASMMPATEAHDLGYVSPVDEREMVAGTQVEVCGEQLYDPFQGLASCVKRKGHSRSTEGPEHEGDYDGRMAAHAEALAMDAAYAEWDSDHETALMLEEVEAVRASRAYDRAAYLATQTLKQIETPRPTGRAVANLTDHARYARNYGTGAENVARLDVTTPEAMRQLSQPRRDYPSLRRLLDLG